MQFREVQGDLFTAPPNEALAHCVSKDLHMGKGIAVPFRQRFGGVPELKDQGPEIGKCLTLVRDGRPIYYLITKVNERYFHFPTEDALRTTLLAMREKMLSAGVRALNIPRIGCGLDRLNWGRVTAMIRDIFRDDPVVITVYSLE
ncbi:putative O-acetyl-ADP-ribose deacetylase 1 [Paratrimastix pyriformis]|uniref:O-acetyl-ADP-ribose deacetylase 1 n=1 Tax=Paratrimastix pyriformis TaxID=342808 RepID=A0ABQ8UKV7_9EUKA|nr:putative O-acetyl-ADP-ribose deacetylase 1 [Paratrimastix pyriformis]